MITQKIKNLFHFIEFLHSNIDNFNQYNGLIKELESLNEVRSNLKPEQNYKEKLQYNKVQAEIESKFRTLQDNTADLIKAKAKELNVCNFDNEPNYFFNGIETEIRQLKKKFSNEDLPVIFKHKNQYLEYRSETHRTFLSLQFFFDELDEKTKSIFDYFKDTDQNEFEAFEVKTKKADTIKELTELAEQGYKIEIPIHSVLKYANNNTKAEKTKQAHQNKQKDDIKTPAATNLKELFNDEEQYLKIIDLLIEKQFIEKGTLIWKDETNGKRSFVAGLIKVLFNKGYLERQATNVEIPAISFNTFKVELSKSISEKTKVNKNDSNYKFIPIATELK